jgi:hypothetical protein
MERIRVPFTGDGAGTGGLTWGQRQVWQAMVEVGTSMSMGGVVPVFDGRTVDDFAGELRFFLSRYPALRSRLRFAPDGTTTQEVSGDGEAFLEVHTAGSADGADALAAEVYAGWRARKFDYAEEWPIRMAVVRAGAGGPVTHVVVMVCHIAADGAALATMVRELGERDTLGPHTAMGPLELAAAQGHGGRPTDAAMRYWEAQLRAIEPQRFPAGFVEPPQPRFRQLVWRSDALLAATDRLSARLEVDAAPILLAAYAVAFGRVVGGGAFATQVIVGNRFRPGLAEVVGPLAQNGLVVVDVAGVTAAEAVARTRQASMSASKHAYYDPDVRQALIDRVGKERGEAMDLAVFYNDRRGAGRAGHDPGEAAILAARPATALVSEVTLAYFNEKFMVNVDDIPDTVQITTEVDTAFLPIEAVRRLLQEMEEFTVAAALDPQAPTF